MSLALAVVLLLLGPAVRQDQSLGYEQVYAVIPSVIGLHMPALSAFAAFWFPQEERVRAKIAAIDSEQAFGAISLTALYLLVALGLLVWPTFVIDFSSPGVELPEMESFAARINDAVKTSLMLSPLAMAPAAFVTRLKPAAGVAPRSADP
ncbi:hypothetical protein WMF27_27285 [Sorangium sp. So ce281]|uniref:hypothetical protein n=1 Tax=unclassified Sorangium TaxID=2621164 RepID=UPI003F608F22